jgi:predicted nicotinamide N-methyase
MNQLSTVIKASEAGLSELYEIDSRSRNRHFLWAGGLAAGNCLHIHTRHPWANVSGIVS